MQEKTENHLTALAFKILNIPCYEMTRLTATLSRAHCSDRLPLRKSYILIIFSFICKVILRELSIVR